MKTFIAVALLAVLLQLGAEAKPVSHVQKCIEELNIDKEKIDNLFGGSIYLPEDDVEIQSFLACVWKKGGYQTENGQIVFDKVIELTKDFPKKRFGSNSSESVGLELATAAADNCKNIPEGSSHGQTIAKVQNCMTKYIANIVKND